MASAKRNGLRSGTEDGGGAVQRTRRFSSQSAESFAIQSSASAPVLKPVMCLLAVVGVSAAVLFVLAAGPRGRGPP
jgi:hypothetical protein